MYPKCQYQRQKTTVWLLRFLCGYFTLHVGVGGESHPRERTGTQRPHQLHINGGAPFLKCYHLGN